MVALNYVSCISHFYVNYITTVLTVTINVWQPFCFINECEISRLIRGDHKIFLNTKTAFTAAEEVFFLRIFFN